MSTGWAPTKSLTSRPQAGPLKSKIHKSRIENVKRAGSLMLPVPTSPIVGVSVVSSASSSVSGSECSEKSAHSPENMASRNAKRKSHKAAPDNRLQRCRERNRIHARKTRLRKKEHMQGLQQKADELKGDQLRLKQIINEKNTASILLGFATSRTYKGENFNEDPRVEELLRRPAGDIPDSTKVPELPALILPGQHASKKAKAESESFNRFSYDEVPNDGFDYELLGKDRSKCTPEELDQIRRERNRMHAKRTRDRKRLFMEEMSEICRQLEEENELLRAHLKSIDADYKDNSCCVVFDNNITNDVSRMSSQSVQADTKRKVVSKKPNSGELSSSQKLSSGNQLQHLLEAARTFDKSAFDNSTKEGKPSSSAVFAVVQATN